MDCGISFSVDIESSGIEENLTKNEIEIVMKPRALAASSPPASGGYIGSEICAEGQDQSGGKGRSLKNLLIERHDYSE